MDIATQFQSDEAYALYLDAQDPLASYRQAYHLPLDLSGQTAIYFVGNSLGPLPKRARALTNQVLDQWQASGVHGHFTGERPWIEYARALSGMIAPILGAELDEVTFTGTLTGNLHLLLETFYRPGSTRRKIMSIRNDFPSDRYAIHSFLALRGYNPADTLIEIAPRPGEYRISDADIAESFKEYGDKVALVLLPAVHFATGQAFNLQEITHLAHLHGALAGFDLAHAAGNIPLQLHNWDVDFAAWCGYKYLSGGPGNGAGIYVHQRHVTDINLLHPAGWWGNNPASRFEMRQDFEPHLTADRFQLSNLPILTLAPLLASLQIYHEAGLEHVWAKGRHLTSYLHFLLTNLSDRPFQILTPDEPTRRGSQLSLLLETGAVVLANELLANGIMVDERPPNIIRVAPLPLYNRYHEAWTFTQTLKRLLRTKPNY